MTINFSVLLLEFDYSVLVARINSIIELQYVKLWLSFQKVIKHYNKPRILNKRVLNLPKGFSSLYSNNL